MVQGKIFRNCLQFPVFFPVFSYSSQFILTLLLLMTFFFPSVFSYHCRSYKQKVLNWSYTKKKTLVPQVKNAYLQLLDQCWKKTVPPGPYRFFSYFQVLSTNQTRTKFMYICTHKCKQVCFEAALKEYFNIRSRILAEFLAEMLALYTGSLW